MAIFFRRGNKGKLGITENRRQKGEGAIFMIPHHPGRHWVKPASHSMDIRTLSVG
jgi:hypothetical protein